MICQYGNTGRETIMTNENKNIIIKDEDQYDLFIETRGFFEKGSSKNVNDINELIKENICFEDF